MTTRPYEGSELELFAQAHNWKAYVGDQLRPLLAGDVLEVGAGVGTTTAALDHDGVRTWTALEPDPWLAAIAKQRLAAGTRTKVVIGMLADLPSTETFDRIVYVDVLEHIEEDADEIELAATHLRPGGLLVVLAPAHQWLFSQFDAAVGHHRRYDRRSLRRLRAPSLTFERCWYLDAAGLLASAANRLILRSAQPSLAQVELWDRRLVPVSRVLDRVLGHRVGKTAIGVWRKLSH